MKIFKLIFSWSAVLAISSFISRWMWVYRDHLLASSFWAGQELDIYFAAFRIPDLIYSLLVFSTIAVAFLPYYLKVIDKDGLQKANIITSRVLNLLMVLIWVMSLIIAVLAPYLVSFYVAWFTLEAKQMVVSLMRIMLFSPILFAISSVVISVQNASHKFFTQALSPILYNAWIIFSILFWVWDYWIQALSYWVIFWALMQLVIQVPAIIRDWFKWYPVFKINSEIKDMAKVAFPRILSMGIYQISLTIDTFIAATLTAWSITAINLASNIASLPLWMIVVSISITAFVYLSKQADDDEKFLATLELNIKKTVYWLFPALFWLYAIWEPLINFLFFYWKFSSSDAELTFTILSFLLLSILFQGFLPLLNRAYFAKWNTMIPLKASLIAMAVNIVISLILSKIIWAVWIAIWTACWMFVYCAFLLIWTKKDFWNFIPLKYILKVLLLSILMCFILFFLKSFIWDLNSLVQIALLGAAGGIFYLGISRGRFWIKS